MNLSNTKKIIVILAVVIAFSVFLSSFPFFTFADYKVEQAGLEKNRNDFLVSPAKVELSLSPGENKTVDITVWNRMLETRKFSLGVEDFTGSRNPDETVVLLGDDRGPYTLKDFLKFQNKTFVLKPGERTTIPVTVSLPTDVETGGRYGSLLVSTKPNSNSGSAIVVSRLGVLFFVKIPGSGDEAGTMSGFRISGNKNFLNSGPVDFQILYENNGSVHLNPYGEVRIKNIWGKEVGFIKLDPWFAMPQSLRSREISWSKPFLFGPYKAIAAVNRGYGDIVDTETISFTILPWKVIVLIVATIIALFIIRRLFKSKRNKLGIAVLVVSIFFVSTIQVMAAVMSSSNYSIERDSLNVGGAGSESANYSVEDTAGDIATGDAESSNYKLRAGYQQMDSTTLSISDADNVTMSPAIGNVVGGTSNGETEVNVMTDNIAGYDLSIKADNNPAMQGQGNGDTIANYTPAGASPDFTFIVPTTAAEFGFTPEGDDVVSEYLDNGSACNTGGAGDTVGACWNAVTTSNELIVEKTSNNQPAGTDTTIKFRLIIGSSTSKAAGTYIATTTLTAVAL